MRSRPGFILVYAMLFVMVLSIAALGMLATGSGESMLAAAITRQATARAAAEAAALDAVDHWSTRAYSELALGDSAPGPMGALATMVIRLDSGLYLVRAVSAEPGHETLHPAAVARAALLVRTLQPAAMATEFTAAVTAIDYAEVQEGLVSGQDSCAPAVPGVHAPANTVQPGALVVGDPPIRSEAVAAALLPDPFGTTLAAALATVTPAAHTLTPLPLAGPDGCIPADQNWGALDPDHPCHDLRPFVHVTDPLTMIGGEGRGVLVVEGDAHLLDGAHYSGLVVVRGRLTIDEGSRVDGAVRAREVLVRDGTVRRDGCALTEALAAPALDQAFRPPHRWWVPSF